MAMKPRKKSKGKVENLRVKNLSSDKAKQVKGGPTMGPWLKSDSIKRG